MLRNETLVLARFFRRLCLKTAADIRHDLSVDSESLSVLSFRVARCASEESHPVLQAGHSPTACREFGGMRSLADETLLGMATNFMGNLCDC
jgi:hypothetical protein